jgi:hypothetical protein
MKLISLNIRFDQVNALAGFEVIVKGYDFSGNGAAEAPIGLVRPMVDV